MLDRVRLKDVCVDIPVFDAGSRSLRHRLVLNKISSLISKETNVGGTMQRDRSGAVVVRALHDINFTLADGDRLALVGHNGAGKTTLLRVICGIYEPTSGQAVTRGRVMPLFNMMEGLAPDATGAEMIRVRGALLGLANREIDTKVEEIAEFCELGDYIKIPVRTYSTGMLVRLMFAITTSVTSDILVMDEFIGGGDAMFFERASARLKKFVEAASVLVVATHSLEMVRKWCNKAVLLEHGRLVQFGSVEDTLAAYERSHLSAQ
jgi:ABC-type polysaccharide/polyol phosphate transport system ATPase subunit